MFKPPGDCPICDEPVPRGRKSCPNCGACPRTGWNEDDSSGNGLDLPDPDFNYDEFIGREFGKSKKPVSLHLVWWITGIVVLIGFVAMFFFGFR